MATLGNYYFTCATTGDVAKVEYTFGYKRCEDGKVRRRPQPLLRAVARIDKFGKC